MGYGVETILVVVPFLLTFIWQFVLWSSYKNFFLITDLPLFLVRSLLNSIYFTPLWLSTGRISKDNFFDLLLVMFFGTLVYIFSLTIFFKARYSIKTKSINFLELLIFRFRVGKYGKIFSFMNIIFFLNVVAISFYIVSYWKMGFIPMFSENPFLAKYLGGEYQELYRPVAPLYRVALTISSFIIYFNVIYFLMSKSGGKILVSVFTIAVFVLTVFTLRRTVIGEPILNVLLLWFLWWKNGRFLWFYILGYLCLFVFGSVANDIMKSFLGLISDFDIIKSTAKGNPDLADLFWFWQSFQIRDFELAFGRTIIGGLVPFQYEWNPSIFTLNVIGAGTGVAHGGFRLPFQIWGFVNFGYVGVIIWSSFTGFVDGYKLSIWKYCVSQSWNFPILVLAFAFLHLLSSSLTLDNILLVILISTCIFLIIKKVVIRRPVPNKVTNL
jgi:hypothetical protein